MHSVQPSRDFNSASRIQVQSDHGTQSSWLIPFRNCGNSKFKSLYSCDYQVRNNEKETKETRVQSRETSSEILGGRSGTGAGFSPSSSVAPR
jgi:hypothetical protein